MRGITRRRAAARLSRRVALAAVATTLVAATGIVAAGATGTGPFGDSQVGQQLGGSILLPTNQMISPAGSRTALVSDARLVSSTLSPDGRFLPALSWHNFSGFLTVIDVRTSITVGNAPRQVVVDGNNAYVTNEGGRPANGSDFTNSSDGTPIVSDPSTGAASRR